MNKSKMPWIFLAAFSTSCFVFWWFPSILLHIFNIYDPIKPETIGVSIVAYLLFCVGCLVPKRATKMSLFNQETISMCEQLSYKLTLIIAIPAFVVATKFAIYRRGVAYGEGEGIPLSYQAILYMHLFFGYMYIGSARDFVHKNKNKVILASFLLVFPRLLISLHWGRYFVGQTVAVLLFIYIGRGWVHISMRRMFQIALLACAVIIIPALTRGERLNGYNEYGQAAIAAFFQGGDTLYFYQEDKNIRFDCQPLLISLTAKTIPYSALHLCTINVGDVKFAPADLGSLLTQKYSNNFMKGTGCIYLLELYLIAGLFGVYVGSFLFGYSCRWFVLKTSYRSIFVGIWAECLSRAIFAPRAELGYVYERIPSLLMATLLFGVICQSLKSRVNERSIC